MDCGGKRSATPLWVEISFEMNFKHKLKRRRAALAAAFDTSANPLNRTLAKASFD